MCCMIQVGIVSDLHAEFWSSSDHARIGDKIVSELADADFILMPGDIAIGGNSVSVIRALFPNKPVFFVAGNHEFYHGDYKTVLAELQALATGNVHFLHNAIAEFEVRGVSVRVIGTTLWTDFDLHNTPDLSLLQGRGALNDFRLITYQERLLQPQDTLEWHRAQRSWLLHALDNNINGLSIVMTHHAPVSFSLHPRYVGNELSPCFASKMEELLIRHDVPLVVWGHTHHCVDRTIETTRFVSNQTGYPTKLGTETGQYGQIIALTSDTGV